MSKKADWIAIGYQTFAFEGPTGLKVERLSRSVSKSKSSFYHHFADLEIFISKLLKYHLDKVREIANEEAKATNEIELIEIFLEYKIDFLFNRQLRIHRDNKDFKACFVKSNEISKPALLPLWKKITGLDDNHYLAKMVFMLSIENFFLQITDETLTEQWLKDFFQSVKSLVHHFRQENKNLQLDGSV